MGESCFISALCTPLTESEELHEAGLEAHLAAQWSAGISGIFVAGSMGKMQMLTERTYRRLVERTVELTKNRCELFAGAGDAGFARTRDRILFLNDLAIDGVVVLTPYLYSFTQAELIGYFESLADIARVPLYLYDLPQVAGTKIEIDTVLKLSKHPNIAGIKCSDEPGYARQLHDRLGDPFRVIIAQADLIDVFLRHGMREHLDGMFAVAPDWTMALARCAEQEDWDAAQEYQERISRLKRALLRYGLAAFTVVLNARGVPGNVAPRPYQRLSAEEQDALLSEPIIGEFVRACAVAA